MIIPAAIGLLISTIFLNFNLTVKEAFLTPGFSRPAEAGRVLGASETNNGEAKILIESDGNLNKAIDKAIAGVKSLPLPRFFQLPEAEQSAGQSLAKRKNHPELIIADNDFSAQNGVVLDYDSDSLCFAKRPDRSWPIASITKLFTAYTFLEFNPGWEADYEIKPEDKREGGKIYLFTGDKVKVKDLFYFSLVGSDNTATAALVRATGLSEAEFVEKMNGKIKELGLKNTRLVDPVGLKDGNISTAREVAVFAKIALAEEEISRASMTKSYEFRTGQGRKKTIASTNELLNFFPDAGVSILGGKTGYINAAGYCLVSQFKNDEGRSIVTVILGADSDSGRFNLTKKLVDLYYKKQP